MAVPSPLDCNMSPAATVPPKATFNVPLATPSRARLTNSSAPGASSVQVPRGMSVLAALAAMWSESLPILTRKNRVAMAASVSLVMLPDWREPSEMFAKEAREVPRRGLRVRYASEVVMILDRVFIVDRVDGYWLIVWLV